MSDASKTKAELVAELQRLRTRLAEVLAGARARSSGNDVPFRLPTKDGGER